MKRPEQLLHQSVATYLQYALPKDVWFAHYPAGGKRSKIEAAILKTMGAKAGVPDLMFIRGGRVWFIELKAPAERLKNGELSKAKPQISEDQEDTMRNLQNVDCEVAICRSLLEVQIVLKMWGLINGKDV